MKNFLNIWRFHFFSLFFARMGQEELDAMWERGEMTQEKLKAFETLHERTPYCNNHEHCLRYQLPHYFYI